jgi:hypothetical protein
MQSNPQGDATKIQNQKFYRSTLDAMKAKEQAILDFRCIALWI